ncbi:MAG: PadR family transcriptional regulator [Candidatus Thorarchaeota archaeon]
MVQQLILLGVLLDGKTHAYRLNEYVTHAMSLYADIKKSTVYYTLEKLEKDGYVEHETEREGKRPERRVYQITEKGKSYFLQLLRDNLGEFTRTYFNDDIGIAFMNQLSTSEVRELLEKKQGMIQSALKQFKEAPDHGVSWHYVISHNVAHLEADLAWIDRILNDLDQVKA